LTPDRASFILGPIMKSMTGFGSARTQSKDNLVTIEASIKSLNSRYLEMRFQMPNQYLEVEKDLKEQIQKHFHRGRLDIFIRRRGSEKSNYHFHVNTPVAKSWLNAYKKLGKELSLSTNVPLETIARLPEVIVFEESMDISKSEKQAVVEALTKALHLCSKERQREGQSLQKELLKLLSKLESQVQLFSKLRKNANEKIKKSMQEKLTNLETKLEPNDHRYAQEVSFLIEKSDISEEIVRLREHLNTFKKMIVDGYQVGKKLDFYTQELLREVNTVGSKSQVVELTEAVVEAKGLIERLREQVQNVE